MRVAFPLGGTDWGRSGIGTYVRAVLPRLAARLAADGGALSVIGDEAELAAYADVLVGTNLVRAPSLGKVAGASALWYLALAAHTAGRAGTDVLLLPAANRRLVIKANCPVVAVVHDLAQLHVEGKYSALRMLYVKEVVTRALGQADVLVAVSQATAKDLKGALGGAAPPMQVVLNGVDHERFSPMASDDPRVREARAEAAASEPYILYASRLEHPGKNHLRLLRAFAKSEARRSHLLLIAGKDWGARGLIEAEIDALGLRPRVRLLGYVADQHLPGLVAGAATVVMVGLHEGFGLPALEALAAGRPVCASSTGALPEVVGDLAALCDPHDEDSIRVALDRAVADTALRERVVREGPNWARQRGWDRTADGLLAACAMARGRRVAS